VQNKTEQSKAEYYIKEEEVAYTQEVGHKKVEEGNYSFLHHTEDNFVEKPMKMKMVMLMKQKLT
jgi:hypothetical protein